MIDHIDVCLCICKMTLQRQGGREVPSANTSIHFHIVYYFIYSIND